MLYTTNIHPSPPTEFFLATALTSKGCVELYYAVSWEDTSASYFFIHTCYFYEYAKD